MHLGNPVLQSNCLHSSVPAIQIFYCLGFFASVCLIDRHFASQLGFLKDQEKVYYLPLLERLRLLIGFDKVYPVEVYKNDPNLIKT